MVGVASWGCCIMVRVGVPSQNQTRRVVQANQACVVHGQLAQCDSTQLSNSCDACTVNAYTHRGQSRAAANSIQCKRFEQQIATNAYRDKSKTVTHSPAVASCAMVNGAPDHTGESATNHAMYVSFQPWLIRCRKPSAICGPYLPTAASAHGPRQHPHKTHRNIRT
jgi:hypothetical protein